MKKFNKLFFLSLLISQISFAETTPKDYTVEEMLNKMYSSSDKIEDMEKSDNFKYVKKYLSDFSEDEQDILSKLYLYYTHEITSKKKDYDVLSEKMFSSLKDIQNILTEDDYITILGSTGTEKKVLPNVKYYIDFDNEILYSEELLNFSKSDIKNLYSFIYQIEYNRLIIFEPSENKTDYFSVINLGDLQKFSFEDLKKSIQAYMNNK